MKLTHDLRHIEEFLRNFPDAGQGRHVAGYNALIRLMRAGLDRHEAERVLRRQYEALGWQDRAADLARDAESAARYLAMPPEQDSASIIARAAARERPWPAKDEAMAARVERHWAGRTWIGGEAVAESCDVMRRLYGPDELVCWARDERDSHTTPRREIDGWTDRLQYVVANPMRATTGRTKDGRDGRPRTQDNACDRFRRRWVVVEFDSATLDQQRAYHCHLHERSGRLRLVVHSGGKSMHGWYDVDGAPHAVAEQLFSDACALGADASLWDVAKLVRMPGGTRADGARQAVLHCSLPASAASAVPARAVHAPAIAAPASVDRVEVATARTEASPYDERAWAWAIAFGGVPRTGTPDEIAAMDALTSMRS